MRAIAYVERHEIDLAIADFDAILRLHPAGSTYVNRARAFNLKQDYDRALSDLNTAMEKGFRNYVVYVNRGDAWRGKGEFDKAITDYDEAIRLNPKAAIAYCGRALAWRGRQEPDKAIADYDEAVRLDPRPFVYVGRGQVWRVKKDYDRRARIFARPPRSAPKTRWPSTAWPGSWQPVLRPRIATENEQSSWR